MPDTELTNLYDLTLPELICLLAGWGQPAYRARQLWEGSIAIMAGEFETMTTCFGEAARVGLAAETTLAIGKIALSQHRPTARRRKSSSSRSTANTSRRC